MKALIRARKGAKYTNGKLAYIVARNVQLFIVVVEVVD